MRCLSEINTYSMLAGMGFVAVLAGATNTPLTCNIIWNRAFGIE